MTDHLSVNRTESYTLHIGGEAHVLSMEELKILRHRLDIVIGTGRWAVGKRFFAESGQEPPHDVWLKDRAGDIAGWIEAHESTNGREGWTWVEWSDGHLSTALHTDPWDTFAPGSEFTVVEAK